MLVSRGYKMYFARSLDKFKKAYKTAASRRPYKNAIERNEVDTI